MAEDTQQRREQGRAIHRRETRRHIWLPLIMGIVGISTPVVLIAIQRDEIWRVRAAAIGDFLYTLLCSVPLLLCAFGTYLVVMVAVIALNKLHHMTQSPLERVELLANGFADRIEALSSNINQRTLGWSSRLEQVMVFFDLFNQPEGGQTDDKPNTQSNE